MSRGLIKNEKMIIFCSPQSLAESVGAGKCFTVGATKGKDMDALDNIQGMSALITQVESLEGKAVEENWSWPYVVLWCSLSLSLSVNSFTSAVQSLTTCRLTFTMLRVASRWWHLRLLWFWWEKLDCQLWETGHKTIHSNQGETRYHQCDLVFL